MTPSNSQRMQGLDGDGARLQDRFGELEFQAIGRKSVSRSSFDIGTKLPVERNCREEMRSRAMRGRPGRRHSRRCAAAVFEHPVVELSQSRWLGDRRGTGRRPSTVPSRPAATAAGPRSVVSRVSGEISGWKCSSSSPRPPTALRNGLLRAETAARRGEHLRLCTQNRLRPCSFALNSAASAARSSRFGIGTVIRQKRDIPGSCRRGSSRNAEP